MEYLLNIFHGTVNIEKANYLPLDSLKDIDITDFPFKLNTYILDSWGETNNIPLKWNKAIVPTNIVGIENTIIESAIVYCKSTEFVIYLLDKINKLEVLTDINKECPICLDNILTGIKTHCNHVFHSHCITEWLLTNNSCPTCNSYVFLDTVYLDKNKVTSIGNALAEYSNSSIVDHWLKRYPFIINSTINNDSIECNSMLFYSLNTENIDIIGYFLNKYNFKILLKNSNFCYKIQGLLRYNSNHEILSKLILSLESSNIDTVTDILSNVIKYNLIDIGLKFYYKHNLGFEVLLNNLIWFGKYSVIKQLIKNDIDQFKSMSYIDMFKLLFNNLHPNQYDSYDYMSEKHSPDNFPIILMLSKIMNKIYKPDELTKCFNINLSLNTYDDICYKDIGKIVSDFKFTIVHSLAITKNGYKILKIFENYILDWNIMDYSDYTPLMDAVRYGDFNTFKYILSKSDMNFFPKCHFYYALLNPDIRILKYMLENKIYDTNYLFKSNNYRNFHISNIPEKYIIKRLRLIEKYHNISEYFIDLTIFVDITNKRHVDYLVEIIFKYPNIFKSLVPIYYSNNNFIPFLIDNIYIHNYIIENVKNLPNHSNYLLNIFYKVLVNYCWKDIRFEKLLTILDYSNIDYNKIITNLAFITSGGINKEKCKCDNKRTCLIDFFKHIELKSNKKLSDLSINPYRSILYNLNKNNINLIDSLVILGCIINYGKTNWYLTETDKYIIKWISIRNTFKRFIRKKKRNQKICFIENISYINDEINYNPNLESTSLFSKLGKEFKKTLYSFNKPLPPAHANICNLESFYNNEINFITEKADGVHIYNIDEDIQQYFYPYLSKLNDLKFDAEYIEKYNMYIIFDIINGDSEDTANNLLELRNLHPFTPRYSQHLDKLNKSNFEDYKQIEYAAFTKYISENKDKNKILWWPKMIWLAPNKNKLFELLTYIVNITDTVFPTDGWILSSHDTRKVKVKPLKHVTIDLKYIDNKFYTKESKVIDVYLNDKFPNNLNIWRCYWDNKLNSWKLGEIRKDKKVANSSTIELELRKQHIYPYKIADLAHIYINTKPYYHISSLFERTGLNNIYKRLSNMHNVNVLDVGCGKKCDNLMSIIKYNLWVGMDIDTSIIEQNKYKLQKKSEWLWCDFTNKWDIDSQKSNLGGNIWLNSNNNWETINQIFDIVLIFNSIHYSAVTETKWINLIEEISKRTKFNSKVYINYLDSNLLNTILDKQIVDKCNYVKK